MDGSRKRRQEELDDALDQLRGFICMDTDFVAVDINGAQHSLSYSGVYVTSRHETEAEGLWRISAGYDPKDGDPAETTEFLVTDAEHPPAAERRRHRRGRRARPEPRARRAGGGDHQRARVAVKRSRAQAAASSGLRTDRAKVEIHTISGFSPGILG